MNNFHGSMMSLVDGVDGSMKSSFNTSTLSLMSVNTTSSISTRVHEFNNKGLFYVSFLFFYFSYIYILFEKYPPSLYSEKLYF